MAASLSLLLALKDNVILKNNSSTYGTCTYGLALILASLTVTNHELKSKILLEKGVTVEQYDTISDMQRIKPTHESDENENPMVEKKEILDPDTLDLCRIRVSKIVDSGSGAYIDV